MSIPAATASTRRIQSMLFAALLVSSSAFSGELASPTAARREPAPVTPNMRALFDESIEWALSAEATNRILDQASAMGFTVYVPCVWHGKGAYYPTRVGHVDARVKRRIERGEDPLAYLIEQAHRRGIEVHAWFTVIKREDNQYPQFHMSGTPTGAYDLHIPAFRAFMVNLISEVTNTYPVDGINLDYIRSMGLCRSIACKTSYKDKYGKDLELDIARRMFPGAKERIGEWNEAALSSMLSSISHNTPRHITISVDAHPLNRISEEQGQFPIRWVNAGLVDLIFDMRYESELPLPAIQMARNALLQPSRLLVLLTNADRDGDTWTPRSTWTMSTHIQQLRSISPDFGIGFWHRPRFTVEASRNFASVWAGPSTR